MGARVCKVGFDSDLGDGDQVSLRLGGVEVKLLLGGDLGLSDEVRTDLC